MHNIKIIKSQSPKVKPNDNELGFGRFFTDHMFVMDYCEEKGWYDPRIVPYGSFQADPAMMVFHYGQAIFEGMKAYRNINNEIVTFRAKDNIARLNVSAERICIPEVDEELLWEALKKLLEIDKDWVPSAPGTSLYIRPFIIATDPFLGVDISRTYKLFIILSPVGAYYKEGLKPVKLFVTDKYVRSAKGGVGYTKTAGNYAASLYAGKIAKEKGYSQVLWLDACEHKYVEEVGAMNIFFRIGDTLITPPLEGSILAGITRDSVIKIARKMGYDVEERAISIDEVYEAHSKGTLKEVFGTGTAAVISPVGVLDWNQNIIEVNGGQMGEYSNKIYEALTGIQYGKKEDPFNWVVRI
jgi:branched-chain amino acid aminotransferase